MAKELTPTQYGKKHGFIVVDLGAGYAHVKDCGEAATKFGIAPHIQISSACDCGNGRVKDMDEACNVYLDDGKYVVKSETVIGFEKAVELGNKWAEEFKAAA